MPSTLPVGHLRRFQAFRNYSNRAELTAQTRPAELTASEHWNCGLFKLSLEKRIKCLRKLYTD